MPAITFSSISFQNDAPESPIVPDDLPTRVLPHIKSLDCQSCQSIKQGLDFLRGILLPNVHGTSGEGEGDNVDGINEFERKFAIRWLTSLIVKSGEWIETAENDNDAEERSGLVDDAASLLALCSGPGSRGALTRMMTFERPRGLADISISLKDGRITSEGRAPDVGMHTWGSSFVLAERVASFPDGLAPELKERPSLRMLELGAGTGLLSCLFGKILQQENVEGIVISTDFLPSVLDNLRSNVELNFDEGAKLKQCPVEVHSLDWESMSASNSQPLPSPFDKPFDLILGADIIYEADHAKWIKTTAEKLLRRDSFFHLIIPLRRTHSAESETVEKVFPSVNGPDRYEPSLAIIESELLTRASGEKGVGDVMYKLFRIGWSYVPMTS
jgi:predicted nicotinamide N-methyase